MGMPVLIEGFSIDKPESTCGRKKWKECSNKNSGGHSIFHLNFASTSNKSTVYNIKKPHSRNGMRFQFYKLCTRNVSCISCIDDQLVPLVYEERNLYDQACFKCCRFSSTRSCVAFNTRLSLCYY